jgi:hypothetical protein
MRVATIDGPRGDNRLLLRLPAGERERLLPELSRPGSLQGRCSTIPTNH